MKVFVYAREKDSVYESVMGRLSQICATTVENISDCDVVVTIGGDGTILKAGIPAAKSGKPLLGINTGRLGFMATLETNELDKLERLIKKDYAVSRRMILEVRFNGEVFHALNDVVLQRGEERLPEFTVIRGGSGKSGNSANSENTEVMKVRADGVIISTPTGSTAYSLSAGGPIVEPELECFLVTALNPHTLFNRSMIFTTDKPLRIRAGDVSVSVDFNREVLRSDEVVITKSGEVLDLIDIDGHNFYDSIHNKLMRSLK